MSYVPRKKKLRRHEATDLALYMIDAGFQNSIIQLCTGLSETMIRAYRDGADNAGGTSAGRLKTAARILTNRLRVVHGGLIINAYVRIADNPETCVDIYALTSAYHMYLDIVDDIYRGGIKPITLNEAFVLARDYRCGGGALEVVRCRCGTDYLVVADQRIVAGCPLCSMSGTSGSAPPTDHRHPSTRDDKDRDTLSHFISLLQGAFPAPRSTVRFT